MGLDQYLYARKFISGTDYSNKGGEFKMTPNPQLDTIIEPLGLTRKDIDNDTPSVIVSVKAYQWRKANQIHEWFVNNVQDGEDNCREYFVSREKLEELLANLGEALSIRNGTHNGDPDITIEDILPTQSGFFFGSTEYDDYYWDEVERTYEAINALLNNHKLDDFDFEYSSSW